MRPANPARLAIAKHANPNQKGDQPSRDKPSRTDVPTLLGPLSADLPTAPAFPADFPSRTKPFHANPNDYPCRPCACRDGSIRTSHVLLNHTSSSRDPTIRALTRRVTSSQPTGLLWPTPSHPCSTRLICPLLSVSALADLSVQTCPGASQPFSTRLRDPCHHRPQRKTTTQALPQRPSP